MGAGTAAMTSKGGMDRRYAGGMDPSHRPGGLRDASRNGSRHLSRVVPVASTILAMAMSEGAAAQVAPVRAQPDDGLRATLAVGVAPLHAAYGGRSRTEDDEGMPPPASSPVFGAADSLRLNLLGGVVSNLGETNGVIARAEFEYFMAERFSIVPSAEFGWLDQGADGDAFLVGGAVLLRWHLLHEKTWTVFADAGVGVDYLTEDVPPGTNRIKFSPQIGVGFTVALEENPAAARLMGGVRWYHLSNARTAPSNEGFDGLMAYLGIGIPF